MTNIEVHQPTEINKALPEDEIFDPPIDAPKDLRLVEKGRKVLDLLNVQLFSPKLPEGGNLSIQGRVFIKEIQQAMKIAKKEITASGGCQDFVKISVSGRPLGTYLGAIEAQLPDDQYTYIKGIAFELRDEVQDIYDAQRGHSRHTGALFLSALDERRQQKR